MAEATGLLALDVGQRRTGLARASSIARLAEPLPSLPTSEVLDRLKKLIAEYNVGSMVIGLPRNLAGEDTAQTVWIRQWVDKAKAKIELPFYWQDEALTSKQAQSFKPSAKSSIDEHSLAAALILQDFLDGPEVERQVI